MDEENNGFVQEKNCSEEAYERLCEENRQRNTPFLQLFREDLVKAELSPKTIKRYVDNADFFLNTYLVYEEIVPMEQGFEKALTFLSTWMEYKCLASEEEIRKMGTTLKRFYKAMMEHGLIPEDNFEDLKAYVKMAMMSL